MDKPPQHMWAQDWTDDKAYPTSYEDWSLFQWAWAFLRRNVEYQSDYAHFAALPGYWPGGGGKTPKWSGRSMSGDEAMDFRFCDPPALPGETSDEYWTRNDYCVNEEMPLEEHLMRKWNIGHVLDPADDVGWEIVSFGFATDLRPPYFLDLPTQEMIDSGRQLADEDELEQVSLRFDVRFSITRQITDAKAILLERREDIARSSQDFGGGGLHKERAATPFLRKLPAYLRAYDAASVDVGPKELAEKLSPIKFGNPDSLHAAEEEAGRAIEAGKALVNGGYKDLLKFW